MAWIRRFILFHGKRHPSTMSGQEVNRFLSHLACECNVSASTQNQALCALLFLYGPVLGEKLDWVEVAIHAKRPERLPVVLTREEVKRIVSEMRGAAALMAKLLYGCGHALKLSSLLRILRRTMWGAGHRNCRTDKPPSTALQPSSGAPQVAVCRRLALAPLAAERHNR